MRDVAELTGLAGDPRRPGEDAASAAARGAARACATTPSHMATLEAEGIEPIDLVCVNLYPFERTVARAGRERGGGGREHRHRRADDDPRGGQEPPLRRGRRQARELRRRARRARGVGRRASRPRRGTGWPTRRSPSRPATTRRSAAGSGCATRPIPGHWVMAHEKFLDLSYGENPHQKAALYVEVGARSHVLSRVAKLHGRALSFNNVLDLDARAAAARRVRPGRVRDRQAQQPLRGRHRRHDRRGLREGARLRPAVGLRRRDRAQPAGRPRRSPSACTSTSSRS